MSKNMHIGDFNSLHEFDMKSHRKITWNDMPHMYEVVRKFYGPILARKMVEELRPRLEIRQGYINPVHVYNRLMAAGARPDEAQMIANSVGLYSGILD